MEKSYFIHNIDWDVDTVDDWKRLPVATILTIEVEGNETKMEIAKKLEDEVSDTYEFCVFDFYFDEVESLTNKKYMKEFILDYAENGFSVDDYLGTLRYLVTTYCTIFDIEVDTYEWDELINAIWSVCKDRYTYTKDDFDNEMSRDLI